MHAFILIATRGLLEILGSVEPSSPNPRRNTSKEYFEAHQSGDEADTCCRSVSTLSPFLPKPTRKWIQRGNKAETYFHF
jgi:hypothetical protein